MFKILYNRFFGTWRETYITTKETEFHRLVSLLKTHSIQYRYKLKTSPDGEPVYNEKVFYISVLDKDVPKTRELFGLNVSLEEA